MGDNRDVAKIAAVRQVSTGRPSARPPSGRTSPLSWLISGLVFTMFGLCIFAGGIFFIVTRHAFMAVARHATAAIVEQQGLAAYTSKNDPPPAFEFKDGAGKTWRETAQGEKREMDYKTGQTVDVYYPPTHPDQAIIGDFDSLWSLPIFMIFISFVPMATGLWTAVIGWRGMQAVSKPS